MKVLIYSQIIFMNFLVLRIILKMKILNLYRIDLNYFQKSKIILEI